MRARRSSCWRRLRGDGDRRAVDGCDWRAFDTLQNRTPVLAIDPPSGFPSSNDFASVLLPVAPPADGSSAAWFLASAPETTGLALVKLDPAGGASG